MIPPANHDPDTEIERYLDGERRDAARRILRVGVVALLFGVAGCAGLYDWWVHGGVLPRVVFAGPMLLLVGVALTGYALLSPRAT